MNYKVILVAAVGLLPGYIQVANADLTANMVADYRFDEGSSVTLTDHTSNNAHGTITSPVWTTHGSRNVLEFNGSTTTINCGTPVSLDRRNYDSTTISGWLFAEQIFSVWMSMPLIKNGQYSYSQGVRKFGGEGGDGFLPSNKWVHYAAVWDGTYTKLYIDGELVGHLNGPDNPNMRPTVRSGAAPSGLQTVQFDGDDKMVTANSALDDDGNGYEYDYNNYTVFIAGEFAADNPAGQPIFSQEQNGSSTGIFLGHDRVDFHPINAGNNPNIAKNVFFVAAIVYDESATNACRLFVNGSEIYSDNVEKSPSYNDYADDLTLGARDGAAIGFKGDIGEVIFYRNALTSPQRDSVTSYLTNKWINGTAASLSVTSTIGAWFDANNINGNGSATADGTVISAWADKSTQVYHADNASRGSGLAAPQNFIIAGPYEGGETIPQYTNRRFKGKMASLRMYNKALSYGEVFEDMRTTNITNSVVLTVIPRPDLGLIRLEVDAARLGATNYGNLENVYIDLEPSGGGTPIISTVVNISQFDPNSGKAEVDLNVPSLSAGPYRLEATAKDSGSSQLGIADYLTFQWAGSAQFPTGPTGAKKLNNLVTELINVPGPDTSGTPIAFTNPREGFIFISNKGSTTAAITPNGGSPIALTLYNDYGDAYETMRYLPAGDYTITAATARNLIVRAICLTLYDYAFGVPYVSEYGTYIGAFEEKYVFPHTNTFLVHDYNIDRAEVSGLKARGRKLMGHGTRANEGGTVAELVAYLKARPDFTHPNYDGTIIDEFANSEPVLATWTGAVNTLQSDPAYEDRDFLMYDYAIYDLVNGWWGTEGIGFMDSLVANNCPLIRETYIINTRTETRAWQELLDKYVKESDLVETLYPNFTKNMILYIASFADGGPQWRTVTLPNHNSMVMMDMQMQLIAAHPSFMDIAGVSVYRSCYASEEMVRLAGRLFRHYCIEGKTERFLQDSYVLGHIENPDFESGLDGWTINAAEPGSIRWEVNYGFHYAQHRYASSNGYDGIVTKRSAAAANTFSQTIKNLIPNKYYSFRMFSGDLNNLTNPVHGVSIDFDNVVLIPDKGFTHIGGRNGTNYKLNWHYRVFRARGTTATLTVSDWANGSPGGTIGQELIYNYIQVQPFMGLVAGDLDDDGDVDFNDFAILAENWCL